MNKFESWINLCFKFAMHKDEINYNFLPPWKASREIYENIFLAKLLWLIWIDPILGNFPINPKLSASFKIIINKVNWGKINFRKFSPTNWSVSTKIRNCHPPAIQKQLQPQQQHLKDQSLQLSDTSGV
jgi:hypothetical protein